MLPWLGLVLGLSALLYPLWWGIHPTMRVDTPSYQEVARAFGHGWGSSLHERTPGYPLILWLTGSTRSLTVALTVVQFICHGAAVWMTLALLQRFNPPRWVSVTVAVALMSPPLTEKAFTGLTEAVTEVLRVAAVVGFVRWREADHRGWAVASGLALGAAAMVRPTYQVFAVLVAAVLVWRDRRNRGSSRRLSPWAGGAAVAMGTVVLVGSLVSFNLARFDYPGMTPLTGVHLSTRTALFVEQLPADEPARPILIKARNDNLISDSTHSAGMYMWATRKQLGDALDLQGAALDRYLVRLNLRLIATNPFEYLLGAARAGVLYVAPATSDRVSAGSGVGRLVIGVVHLVVLAGFVVQAVGMVGLALARRLGAAVAGPFSQAAPMRVWLVSNAVIFYTGVISTFFEVGDPRLRTPTDPLILLVVVGGLWTLHQAVRGAPPVGREGWTPT